MASSGKVVLVLAFRLLLARLIILLIFLAVVVDCAESSVSELDDDDVSEPDDELKYCAAGPGWVSLSMTSRGVDSYMYECELSWKSKYKTYTSSRMTLTPLLTCRTLSSAVLLLLNEAWNAVGSRRLVTLSDRRQALICVTVLLYICSRYRNPPKRKHIPRMSNKFARIEPSSEACTILISFFTRAMLLRRQHTASISQKLTWLSTHMKMINSTAFPNVTFIRAPIVSPIRTATLSVAWLNRPARGMIAMAFMAKTMPADAPANLTAMPTGTKTSKTLM